MRKVDSLEDAREICADGTYFPNILRTHIHTHTHTYIYIYINNIFVSYILLNVSIHMYHLLGVLYFYFAS